MNMGEESSINSLVGVPQRIISLKIDLNNNQLFNNLISGLGATRDIARLVSLGLPHAGDRVNVVPSPALGLHLHPAEFIVSAKYRLGMDISSRVCQCTACPQPSHGHHCGQPPASGLSEWAVVTPGHVLTRRYGEKMTKHG